MAAAAELIETDLTLIGATAIEDKLQEVSKTMSIDVYGATSVDVCDSSGVDNPNYA